MGGIPFNAISIYAMIHYLEREWGVYFAIGGTGAIVNGLVRFLTDLGGKVHLNAEVEQILVRGRRSAGVRLVDGREIPADVVVSIADSAFTYHKLIAAEHRRKYTDRHLAMLKHSMSLFVSYFGTKRRYTDKNQAYHNIILSMRYKDLLSDLFNKKSWRMIFHSICIYPP